LILENLLKYGWRLNFISYISRSLAGRGNLPLVLAFPALVALSLLALAVERLGLYCLKVEEQVGGWDSGGGGGRCRPSSEPPQLRNSQDCLLFVILRFP
jgi:hypothetical protein